MLRLRSDSMTFKVFSSLRNPMIPRKARPRTCGVPVCCRGLGLDGLPRSLATPGFCDPVFPQGEVRPVTVRPTPVAGDKRTRGPTPGEKGKGGREKAGKWAGTRKIAATS